MIGVFEFLAILAVCWCVCHVMALRVRKKDSYGFGEADAATMQEIDRGLHRMEERIEALETILLERTGYGSKSDFD